MVAKLSKKKMVLVESPHKAKAISGFLPASQYKVLPTVGAMFDIANPTSEAGKKKYDAYGVDTKTWDLNLKCTNPKQFALIKKELDSGAYDELIVSTDPDRAGSVIGQEVVTALSAVIKRHKIQVTRATWTEITKKAVLAGLANKGVINQLEVDAGTARQAYDRLFGFAISGNVQKTLREKSAGRVQSPALRLIVEREKARLAFVAAEYLSLTGSFAVGPQAVNLEAKLLSLGPKKIATSSSFDSDGKPAAGVLILNEGNSKQVQEFLKQATYAVDDVTVKPYSRKAPTPYTTSTFQQDVGTRLRLSSKQLMNVAQRLFDASWISYMRTDSPHLGDEALAAAYKEAVNLFGVGKTPGKPTPYKAKGQGGHEAIRPVCDEKTGLFRSPKSVKAKLDAIDKHAYAVYEAIYNRTVASQMNPAVGFTTTVKIASTNTPKAKTAVFATAATTYTDLGWMALTKPVDEEDAANVISDKIEKEMDAVLKKLEAKEHKTTPPARYTEPKLVQKLSDLEIGRPSTFASIVTVNQTRGYVGKKGGQLYPNWSGMKVAQYLEGKIPAFVAYAASAQLEEDLDKIEQGTLKKADFLKREWARIQKDVLSLNSSIDWDEVNKLSTVELPHGYAVRVNAYGAFLENTSTPVDADGRRPGVKLGDNETVADLDFSDPEVCKKLFQAAKKQTENRELGVLTNGTYAGWTVTAREGRYGPFLQAVSPAVKEAYAKGEKPTAKMPKPVNHPLPEGAELSTVELSAVEALFSEVKLPRTLSPQFFVGIGKKGQYLGHKANAKARKASFVSLPESYDPRTITLEEAKQVWAEAKK